MCGRHQLRDPSALARKFGATMGYETLQNKDGRSVHSEAFDIAVDQLRHNGRVVGDPEKSQIVAAIMDLFTAGQVDPEKLAVYAVSKVRKSY